MDLATIKYGISKAGQRWDGGQNDIDDLRNHISDLENVLYDVVAYLQDLEEAGDE